MKRAEISDVRGGVNRRAAGVDAYFARMNWVERLQVVRQRVVKAYLVHFVAICKTVIVSDVSSGGKPSSVPTLRFCGEVL